MNSSKVRGATAATTLLLAVGTAATLFAQSSPTPQERQNPTGQNPTGHNPGHQGQPGQQGQLGQHGKEFEQIAGAYRSLHQITLSALQQEARSWKETKSSGPSGGDLNRGTGDANRGDTGNAGGAGGASSSSPQMTLRGDELLIAACTEGLIAGAPSTMAKFDGSKPDARPAGTDGDGQGSGSSQGSGQDRPAQAGSMQDGQCVGMLIVCQHSVGSAAGTAGIDPSTRKGENEPREAAGDRNASTREASASMAGPLKEGAYCVKQSGSSVWLVDEQGQTVLRTSLGKPMGAHDPRDVTGGGASDRRGEHDMGMSSHAGSNDWNHVFGAIAQEAMSSMGWAKPGAPASMR